jgi:uncharacterized iron-regulated membrane protein
LLDLRRSLLNGTLTQEMSLFYETSTDEYTYNVYTDRELSDNLDLGATINFDATSGKMKGLDLRAGQQSGSTVSYWLTFLHADGAQAWGLPYQLFQGVMGLVITMFSITGVYIWYKKRRAAEAKLNKILQQAPVSMTVSKKN